LTIQPALKRTITIPLLTLYGLGTIIGAGIYVLVGEVVGEAGLMAPFSFLLAAVIAAFTGFTYAELSSRFPRSAGEAYYSGQAFNSNLFSGVIGWSIVLIGVVSAATIVNGFVGYFHVFVDWPGWMVIIGLVLILAAVAAWGISESVWLASIITVIEVSGLLFVVFSATQVDHQVALDYRDFIPMADGHIWYGIVMGAFLAFYAYIGFEDMVNVAEEVINPQKTLPLAIILALVFSVIIYIMVSIAAVTAVPVEQLDRSTAPLVDIVRRYDENAVVLITLVSMIAVVNGALIQMIMASRVIYGMADQRLAPLIFSRVNARTQTPLLSTALVTLIVLTLALSFSLVTLAKITSFITLLIFAAMHVSLLVIKRRAPAPGKTAVYPVWIPVTGLILSLALAGFQTWVSLVG
jgi:amino acid transporter